MAPHPTPPEPPSPTRRSLRATISDFRRRAVPGRRPILVAVGRSPSSEAALRLAVSLACAMRSPLIVAGVLPIETHAMSPIPSFANGERIATENERLEQSLARAEAEIGKVPASRITIAFGLVPQKIADIAAADEAAMIVMGAGPRGILDRLFGSVAERTCRIAPCPLVRVDAGPTPLRALSIASDGRSSRSSAAF